MKETKNNNNKNSLLSNIDKISYFKNNTKKRKPSIQKEINLYKLYTNEYSTNHNISTNDNNTELNNFISNNNNYIKPIKISLTKQNQNNFAHKRSFSKTIFKNINVMNNNNNFSLNKKNNISSGGFNNNSHEKNTPPLFINKNKGIILNKVNLFKNVKFKKPSLYNSNNNKNISNINSNNSNNSNTNTVIQSLSSLNMTSTDITTSTKRKKDSNIFNTKEIPNHTILKNDNNTLNTIHNNNQINNNLNNLIKNNNKQNRNKHFYNLTNCNLNKNMNTNSTFQYYKDIIQNSNNILSKIKKPDNKIYY